MNRIVLPLALPLLLLAACSRQQEPTPDPKAFDVASAPAVAASDAASPAPTASASAARVSRYTSLKDCKVVESPEDEDWAVLRCQGLGGVSVTLNYGDARDDLELTRAGKPPIQIGLPYVVGGGFNKLGDTVEWRGTGNGAAFVPAALIVRNHSSQDPEHSERSTALLAVIDLAQGCAVAQVRPRAGQNEEARAIADGPRRACLREGTVSE